MLLEKSISILSVFIIIIPTVNFLCQMYANPIEA